MGSAPSNEEPRAGPRPLTRRWRRSHPASLGTGHRPAAVQRPQPPPPCSVLIPLSRAERQRGRQWLNSLSFLSAARLRRAVCSSGAASVGLGFRDEPPGAARARSGRRVGSILLNLLTLRRSGALEVMRLVQEVAAGAGS